MNSRRVALLLACSPLLLGCAAVEDYVTPEPTPELACDPWNDPSLDDLPECPRSTAPAPLTDAEVEEQWEEGERERARQEEQFLQEAQMSEGSCIDVTSYDNNWDNDVLCTRQDGTQFYTSYEGANSFLAGY